MREREFFFYIEPLFLNSVYYFNADALIYSEFRQGAKTWQIWKFFYQKFSGLGNKRQSKVSVNSNLEAKDPNTTSPEMSNVHSQLKRNTSRSDLISRLKKMYGNNRSKHFKFHKLPSVYWTNLGTIFLKFLSKLRPETWDQVGFSIFVTPFTDINVTYTEQPAVCPKSF